MRASHFSPAPDLETIKSMLETADIDFEEYRDEEKDLTYVETASGVYFTFNADEELVEVANG